MVLVAGLGAMKRLTVEVEDVRLVQVLSPHVLHSERLSRERSLLVVAYTGDELVAPLRPHAKLHVETKLAAGKHSVGHGVGEADRRAGAAGVSGAAQCRGRREEAGS